MIIYVVRHAQTQANKDGIIQGQQNTDITKEGMVQAKRMASLFFNAKVSKIYSSPIRRAFVTASLIGQSIGFDSKEIVICPQLQEIDLEPWVYKRIADLDMSNAPSSYKTYKTRPAEFVPTSGESLVDVRNRVFDVYQKIISASKKDENIVIVSHSVAIRTLLSVIDSKSLDYIWEYQIPPASITKILYDGINSFIQYIGAESPENGQGIAVV